MYLTCSCDDHMSLQLNGSAWRRCKLTVEEARPDFRQRLALEAVEDAERCDTDQDSAAAADSIAPADDSASADEAAGSALRIRVHTHGTMTVPYGTVTGTQRKLFMPVAPLPLEQWVTQAPAGPPRRRSALQRINKLWDAALQRRVTAEALDVSAYERLPSVVPPQVRNVRREVPPAHLCERDLKNTPRQVRHRCWKPRFVTLTLLHTAGYLTFTHRLACRSRTRRACQRRTDTAL